MSVTDSLLALRDEDYRNFHMKLIPNVATERIIGIRTPVLRNFARDFAKSPWAETFLATLPHYYYEENNLHGILISRMRDPDACVAALDRFLPFVDNWATSDLISPASLSKAPEKLLSAIHRWIDSGETYAVRFAIGRLMAEFLDERFSPEYPELVASVKSGEYYINMMRAWYFATALAKRYDEILPYFTGRRLDVWTHNKAIRKAIESFRVTDSHKDELRTLAIKEKK